MEDLDYNKITVSSVRTLLLVLCVPFTVELNESSDLRGFNNEKFVTEREKL